MKNLIFFIRNYFSHHLTAITKYKLHSPFLYKFLKEIVNGKSNTEIIYLYKYLQKKLNSDRSMIRLNESKNDGKGKFHVPQIKRVNAIFKQAAISSKKAQVLARLLVLVKPENVIEIGTSLGVAGCIMAQSSPASKIFMIENDSSLVSKIQVNIRASALKNIEIQVGNFKDVLDGLLNKIKRADVVFYNGTDDIKSMLNSFEKCLLYKGNNSVFVFNSIYRSKPMKEGWEFIKKHPETVVSIDLFQLGIVLFKKELSRQQIKYRY